MQTNNELLKKIAQACNLHFEADGAESIYVSGWGGTNRTFNPFTSNDDCMRMCSAMKLNTKHADEYVECFFDIAGSYDHLFASIPLAEHGGDRLAAWREAACTLATMDLNEAA